MLSLINRSHYSLGFGSLHLKDIVSHALKQPEKTAALTDMNTLTGIPEFLAECKKQGVKGIAGLTVRVGYEGAYQGDLVLLANDAEGFDAINDVLNGVAQDEKMSQCGLTDISKISNFPAGKVTVLDGFSGSVLHRNGSGVSERLLKQNTSDYTVALTPSSMPGQISVFDEIEKLSQKGKVNFIKTSAAVFNPVMYMSLAAIHRYRSQLKRVGEKDDMAMDVISEMTYLSDDKIKLWNDYNLSLKEISSTDALLPQEKFTESPDLGILASTNKVEPLFEQGGDFKQQMQKNLDEYLSEINADEDLKKTYYARLDEEFDAFREIDGAEVYIQNTKAIFDLGREKGLSLRPRGSAAGSLAIFLMIDANKRLDPMEHELSFSRFMDKNRKEMPDVDIDVDNRKLFTEVLQERFGRENTVGIKTFDTIKSAMPLMKLALDALSENVGVKSNEHFVEALDDFEKAFKPFKGKVPKYMSFDELLQQPAIQKAYRHNEIMHQMISVARRFQNTYVTSNMHNGGVLFSTTAPFSKTMATIEIPGKQLMRSELNINGAKLMGQIKYDATLSSEAGNELEIARKQLLEMHNIDLRENLNDPMLYKAIQRDALNGIYQLSGDATRSVVNAVQPKDFFDVMACITLAKAPKRTRDNSTSDLEKYLHNKTNGLSVVSERLVPHLSQTHGVILFDEQITDICMDIAGFTFTEGDTLRSAFKKKRFNVIDELKDKFIKGAVSGGLSQQEANAIFSDLERKKDSYTMPKSHAAMYVKVAMEQLHLKVNYPDTYMNVYAKPAPKVGAKTKSKPSGLTVEDFKREYVQKLGYQIRPLDVLKTPSEGGLMERAGVRYIVDGLNNRFDEKMVNAILTARKHESFSGKDTPNIVEMVHVISEAYLARPLPDPTIQNDNAELKALVGDIIKLSEQGGFRSVIGEPVDKRTEELSNAIPEVVNKIATGRELPVYQNDNPNIKQSR